MNIFSSNYRVDVLDAAEVGHAIIDDDEEMRLGKRMAEESPGRVDKNKLHNLLTKTKKYQNIEFRA